MKLSRRAKTVFVGAVSACLMVATVPLAIWITHSSGAQLENARRRCDRVDGAIHSVQIQNGAVKPTNTTAKKCDSLVIKNLDSQPRLMAFGPHDSHISYNGISEELLTQGQSLRVVLIKTGTYIFHDHIQESVRGSFTVR